MIRLPDPINVRFRPGDRAILETAAHDRGESLSAFVRRAAIAAARATVETKHAQTEDA